MTQPLPSSCQVALVGAHSSFQVALVGAPNAGKTALFNLLTGRQQRVANYPGVTVERKSGTASLADGRRLTVVDLPGLYSLSPTSADEQVTFDVLHGLLPEEGRPNALICVVNACALPHHLRLVLQLKALGLPIVVALNMMDLAAREGLKLDVAALSRALGVPVVTTVAVRRQGREALLTAGMDAVLTQAQESPGTPIPALTEAPPLTEALVRAEARRIAALVTLAQGPRHRLTRRLDAVVLHPVIGPLLLLGLLFLMFQAVFAWAEAPMDLIDGAFGALGTWVGTVLPVGWLRSLLVDGIIVGVGSVVIFLPQILILFLFILLLEQTGYMARAAFLMDRLMAGVGLNGRAFIPLLSSFACAIPGIMAARTIEAPRDRLTTILIAPLMTCSARLPVYAVIIAAFIPNRLVGGLVGLQGLVLLGLYLAGLIAALLVAFVLKKTLMRGPVPPFLLEMPPYHAPVLRDLAMGLWLRARIFLQRAGGIILLSMILLWALSSFPAPPPGATGPAIDYSITGFLAGGLEKIFAPIGFNREIAIALVPGMAAREVAVGALGTVYALSGDEAHVAQSLAETLRTAWSLPTALAFLAWFVFAPQCISTLAVTRRETNSWRWPMFMAAYLFLMAYAAAGAVYWGAVALGW